MNQPLAYLVYSSGSNTTVYLLCRLGGLVIFSICLAKELLTRHSNH